MHRVEGHGGSGAYVRAVHHNLKSTAQEKSILNSLKVVIIYNIMMNTTIAIVT
jgi:hypothetical protein